jgi:GH35 family endo-1,4-beta-xylanase
MAATNKEDLQYLDEVRGLLPNPGQPFLGDLLDVDLLNVGFARPELGEATVVKAEDADFSQAIHVEVREPTDNGYDVVLNSPDSDLPIAQGDMLSIIYSARCLVAHDESGEGQVQMYLQKGKDPWTGLAGAQRRLGKKWQRFYTHATASRDWQAGDVNLSLHMSPFEQVIEIGGIVVLNLGQQIDIAKLPANELTYKGREPDAPWRAEAAKRIEQHRKGDLTIEVRDLKGNLVVGAPVHARMTRHAYGFGSFFDYKVLGEDGKVVDTKDAKTYAEWYLKLFSKATTPVYWADWGWENPATRADYHRRAKWLQDHDFPTRGHVLVWPSWRWLPGAMKALEHKPEELRRKAHDHVIEVVDAMRGYDLLEYDVMNEPRVNHDLMDILGDEVMLSWWKAAHETDKRQTLCINEYSLLTGAGYTQSEQDAYEKTIRYLLDNGAPLGGIGMQGHMAESMTAPARILEIIDRFARFNLPIQVTEFDIDIDDEQAQADYTRDFFTAVFSHPATNGIIQWGFWEGSHWKPRSAMFRRDWSIKPNGQAYMDLVLGKWWTDEQGVTDSQGRFTFRGFCGEYAVTVGEEGATSTCVLPKEGYKVKLSLKL